MRKSYQGFNDGQRVEHKSWRGPSGKPLRGTVRVFDTYRAEIRWDGTFVATDDFSELRKI